MFSISIVIPNWNGIELLKKHLPTVIKNSDNADIIVVDDHSTDGSVEFLKKHYPDIRVIEKKNHEGFASTVNAGVEEAKSDIVVLLNTDIEPEKDFLKPLIPHFSDPSVFAVGCMDKSIEDGKVVLRGKGIGWWEKGFYLHKKGSVDMGATAWVSGGSGAFRRSMWVELHGMDNMFDPFYWEDIDLSYRANKKGYKTLFEPNSTVFHYHEKGKIKSEYTSTQIQEIAYRNQFIFIWKHATLIQLLVNAFWLPIRLIQNMNNKEKNMISGLYLALSYVPQILTQRVKNY